MTSQNYNPFVLPGLGQSGDMAQNPLMASMEMMRQAWQGLASAGGMDHSAMAAPMSLEDLDRRINDLRAVENWLRMNLSMLSSTIQGLEVQRATISTLKSFMDNASSSTGVAPETGPSPLEVVLGIRPAAQRDASPAHQPDPQPEAKAQQAAPGNAEAASASAQTDAAQASSAAAQGWWDMVQQQFDTLAAATAATLQNAEAARAAAQKAEQASSSASSDSTMGATRKPTGPKVASAAPSARKAAKKTPARKRAPASRRKES